MASEIDIFTKKFNDDDRERAFQAAMKKSSDQLQDEMVKAGRRRSEATRHVKGLLNRIGGRAIKKQYDASSDDAKSYANGIAIAQGRPPKP